MTLQSPSVKSLYQQLPLKQVEIRILRLEPSTPSSPEIRASLVKRSLLTLRKGGPSFEALSYTWGLASVTKDIVINGTSFPVTANLYAFLQQYQEPDKTADLWIDAICINQADLLEKNHQIPMMNMIYASAKRLVIWLGEASSDSELAIKWIEDLGMGSPYDKMPNIPNNAWQAMQSFLERPWWKRIWIVPELATGAMGIKLETASVLCGHARISWINLVIAAARMKAHEDDKRQAFPTITEILELDSLRESAGHYFLNQPEPQALFDLICRYRHFLATNRRDKIYAIWNMFARLPSRRLETRYDQSMEEVYLLRHCGNGDPDIPSWAPDWSVPLGSLPLPLRSIQRYFDVPWWVEPEYKDPKALIGPDGTRKESKVGYFVPPIVNSAEAEKQREQRIKRLEWTAKGSAVVKSLDDIPAHFTIHGCPAATKEQIKELLPRDDVVFVIADESRHLPEDPDAVQQGELITERKMKRWLLQELRHSAAEPPYKAASSVSATFKVNKSGKSLQVKGILWDEVEVCHDGFVEDVDRDFADATRFMVGVGCCKHLAMTNQSAASRYPQVADLLEAFCKGTDGAEHAPRCQDWLPEIPDSWTPGKPPVTATTTGLVDIAEMDEALSCSMSAAHGEGEGSQQFTHQLEPNLKERLASSWSQQPYDLYHRPFDLLNVVPDPYWETRRQQDDLAKQQAKQRKSRYIQSSLAAAKGSIDLGLWKQKFDKVDEALRQQPSLVPQDTLPAGIEKYALGRRFFITKKGYFGLGPQKARAGDRIAVLFGSGVSFVLRRCHTAEGKRVWRIVGESYVHGIMQGEVIQKWEFGSAEAQMLHLV
ncbi:HET-domain-containing protein [Trichoderma citrinoviride]|uniref:HET-domain-containing protein n=1 Tax=Trichoderma citrinoviride TaxID=58853 RepID=A0A2T4AYX0_9HYPO|nr:HET-domain-containing protein [Trichoderma citrinoviride]PTB62266.1 HET-domain-containing protein [Trichoderma citrinoviride]